MTTALGERHSSPLRNIFNRMSEDRHPPAADRRTWIMLAAYTRLRPTPSSGAREIHDPTFTPDGLKIKLGRHGTPIA